MENNVLAALRRFAAAITEKMQALAAGEREDQLRAPFERLMEDIGEALSIQVVSKGESLLPGRLGKPDYAVHSGGVLAGSLASDQCLLRLHVD